MSTPNGSAPAFLAQRNFLKESFALEILPKIQTFMRRNMKRKHIDGFQCLNVFRQYTYSPELWWHKNLKSSK